MNFTDKSLASCALLLLSAAVLPAWAASSATSSASDSASTSVGSVSGSIEKSSDSSTKPKAVAAGEYKIIDVATLVERPGMVRMQLQAQADASAEGAFFLWLPQATAEQSQLAQGQLVTARPRAYGVEFANTRTAQAFFLVLSDDWYRELQSNPVVL